MEPTGKRFKDLALDGIIDGIFSGFEARKVAETPHVEVRELRMHPYFFPTGVNDAPSFLEGGNPTLECKTYWMDIRRALLRDIVDRIGFGGYLHLVENHPDFIEYVVHLTDEFRMLRNLHENDKPYAPEYKVAILSAWGRLRAWGCCGHYNRGNYYNEVMESLSGLPLHTDFISFEDILNGGIPSDIKVIINAGKVNDSWSGGHYWSQAQIIEALSEFVYNGGGFIGIGEPSALKHSSQYFQLCHILGVDRETGLTRAFQRFEFDLVQKPHFILKDMTSDPDFGKDIDNIYVLGEATEVLAARDKSPMITVKQFGHGRSIYLSGHKFTPENVRLLHRAIFYAAQAQEQYATYICSNIHTECAYYPNHRKLAVINNSNQTQNTLITLEKGKTLEISLEPYGSKIFDV
jgi:beta-D-galactosyl-(1->4)-L-rhamnose phosphorylase